MPVSHTCITKMSVTGFFKNSVGLYNYYSCYYYRIIESYYYYGSGAEKEVGFKVTSLPNLYIHCLLDAVVTCV